MAATEAETGIPDGTGSWRFRVAVLVTAAGSSARFGSGKKELALIGHHSVLDRALFPFCSLPGLCAIVITAPAGRIDELRACLDPDTVNAIGDIPFAFVEGGATRRDSVLRGLEALEVQLRGSDHGTDEVVVLVHDGARPWASREIALKVAEVAARSGACIPVIPLSDTPKEISPGGLILSHPRRASLGGAQTPQGFFLAPLLAVHRQALAENVDCTDDAELWSRYRGPVSWVEGEVGNRKVTYREDIPVTEPKDAGPPGRGDAAAPATARDDRSGGSGSVATDLRIGEGWDLHRLVPGRKLVIGSVTLESPLGEDAHSDGDVLWHAVTDALIGACALGDIGSHFPPEDMRWKDADSAVLAATIVDLVRKEGYRPVNLDCTVVLESPKIGPHRDLIRANLARVLGMEPGRVSVKAKTHEKVDAVGELRAIEAHAIVLVERTGF